MADYESGAPPSVTFTFHEEGPRIVYSDGGSSPLPATAFARSQLLREMCESEGLEGQRASVSLSPEHVYTWLAFIEPADEHGLVFASDDHLVTVLQVCAFWLVNSVYDTWLRVHHSSGHLNSALAV